MGNSFSEEPREGPSDTGWMPTYRDYISSHQKQTPDYNLKVIKDDDLPKPKEQKIEQEKRKKKLITSFKLEHERVMLKKNLKKLSDRVKYLENSRGQQNQDEIVNNIARCAT